MSSWGSLCVPLSLLTVRGDGRGRHPSLTCRVTKSPECLSQGPLTRFFSWHWTAFHFFTPWCEMPPYAIFHKHWVQTLMDTLGGYREKPQCIQPSSAVTPRCHSSPATPLQYPAHPSGECPWWHHVVSMAESRPGWPTGFPQHTHPLSTIITSPRTNITDPAEIWYPKILSNIYLDSLVWHAHLPVPLPCGILACSLFKEQRGRTSPIKDI